jgi:hypothetical protein
MAAVLTRRTDTGIQTSGYGVVFAHVMRDLLKAAAAALERPALVGQVARVPILQLLERHTAWGPIYAFDPRSENVEFQRQKVSDHHRVQLLDVGVTELPPEVRGIQIVINPLGLQEFPGEHLLYAASVRERCTADAEMVTMDWGLTDYPEDIVDLPGVRDEIKFAEDRQLAPFGEDSGWQLTAEHEYDFFLRHTGAQVAAILPEAKVPAFRRVVPEDRILDIRSSILVRHYAAVG